MSPLADVPPTGVSGIPAMPARKGSFDALTMGRPCCTIANKRDAYSL